MPTTIHKQIQMGAALAAAEAAQGGDDSPEKAQITEGPERLGHDAPLP